MSASTLLHTLFRYQAWANSDLLDKIESIDPVINQEERHTVIRLINHCHVVNRIFAAHLSGTKHSYTSDNTADTPLLPDLRSAVAASDRWYLQYLETVTPEQLGEAVPFAFTDGDSGCMSREEMLAHVVTHGGYHRGEAGRILSQISISPPWDTLAVHLHQTEPSRRLRTPMLENTLSAS